MTPNYEISDTISPSLVNEGKELSILAQRVVEVTPGDEAQMRLAVQVGQQIHVHLQMCKVELQRLIGPAVTFESLMRALYHDHTEPLIAHKKRISALLAPFVEAEEKRVKEQKEEQEKEVARLEAERQKALSESLNGNSISSRIAAEQRANELVATIREVAIGAAVALRTEGMRVNRGETQFEILDLNAAYKHSPHLFNPPTPKSSLIKALPVDTKIDGIRLYTETKVNFTR